MLSLQHRPVSVPFPGARSASLFTYCIPHLHRRRKRDRQVRCTTSLQRIQVPQDYRGVHVPGQEASTSSSVHQLRVTLFKHVLICCSLFVWSWDDISTIPSAIAVCLRMSFLNSFTDCGHLTARDTCRVATLQEVTAEEGSLSTARSLRTRTSGTSTSTLALAFCPWPMLEQTQMDHNFSSPPLLPHILTAATVFSARSSMV